MTPVYAAILETEWSIVESAPAERDAVKYAPCPRCLGKYVVPV